MIIASATVAMFAIGIGLSVLSHLIFRQKVPAAIKDENSDTVVSRGGYVPRVIGRHRVAPVIGYISEPILIGSAPEANGNGGNALIGSGVGGKRQNAGGTSEQTWAYHVWHIVCVGPVARLHGIWANGSVDVWSTLGYDPRNTPSGTQIFPLRGSAPAASGRVYWGESDQPIDPQSTNLLQVSSNWPLVMHVWWSNAVQGPGFFVGNIKQLPLIEYEVSCVPQSILQESPPWLLARARQGSSALSATVNVSSIVTGPIGTRRFLTANGGFDGPGTWKAGDIALLVGPVATTMFGTDRVLFYVWKSDSLQVANGQSLIYVGPEATRLGAQVLTQAAVSTATSKIYRLEQLDDDGANLAHMLAELMFASYPYGCGAPVEDFDIASLEAIGRLVDRDREDLSGSIRIQGGEFLDAHIGALMQDLGLFLVQSSTTGLLEFVPIRSDQPLVTIPRELLSNPHPAIQSSHEEKQVDRVSFSFSQRTRNYRSSTFEDGNDGSMVALEAVHEKNVEIRSVTDSASALKIAIRRALEELPTHAVVNLEVQGLTRLLSPGRRVKIANNEVVPFNMRVDTVELNVLTGRVQVTCIQDVFADSGEAELITSFGGAEGLVEFLDDVLPEGPGSDYQLPEKVEQRGFPVGRVDGEPASTPEDTLVVFYELPRWTLADRRIRVVLARVRASEDSELAKVFISSDDVTYTLVDENVPFTTGGTLAEDLSADGWILADDAIVINAVGPDAAILGGYVADDTSWALGRLSMLIDEELFYVKGLTAIGGGQYTVDSPLRGRMATKRAEHLTGANVVFLVDRMVKGLTDVILQPNRTVYFKVQPRSRLGETDIGLLTVHELQVQGKLYAPAPVACLRIPEGYVDFYPKDEDIPFVWAYGNGDSLRTGAGAQGAGDPVFNAPVEGTFVLEIHDTDPLLGGSSVLRRVDDLQTASYVYAASDRYVDFSSSEPDEFWVKLYAVKSGFASEAIYLHVTLLD
jgi:hypothetical protein